MAEQKLGDLNGKWALLVKVLCVLMAIYIPINFTFQGWLGARIIDHSIQLSAINASRWTAKDQADFQAELTQQLSQIQVTLSRLPKTFPPEETEARLKDIEARLRELEIRSP